MSKKVVNYNLSEEGIRALEVLAKAGQSNKSQTVEDSIWTGITLARLGRQQLLEAVRTLHRRIGDALAIIAVEQDENGDPVAHLVIGHAGESADVAGLKAVGQVVGDRCYVFLDFGDLPVEPATLQIGSQVIRVPLAQLHIGDVSWPPDPREAIRIPIEYYSAELAKPDPLEVVGA